MGTRARRMLGCPIHDDSPIVGMSGMQTAYPRLKQKRRTPKAPPLLLLPIPYSLFPTGYAVTGSNTSANFLPLRAAWAFLWNAYPAISGNAIVASAYTICS